MEPADHPVLDEALFAGYVAGLREALHPQVGTRGGDEPEVELAADRINRSEAEFIDDEVVTQELI